MRLVCPNCEAKYEVPDDAIPDTGRDVQCANCNHAWFQMRARSASAAVPAEAVPPPVEPVAETVAAAAADQPAHVGNPDPVPDIAPEVAAAAAFAEVEAALGDGAALADPVAPIAQAMDTPSVPADAEEDTVAAGAIDPLAVALADPVEEVPSEPVADEPSDQDLEAAPELASEADTESAPDATPVAEALDDIPVATTPEPVAEPMAEAAASDPVEPEPEPVAPIAAAIATGAAPYAVDESVLAILREEAEREANARRADALALESQTDLGIDSAHPAPAHAVVAEAKPSARRDLLPDVEEINSTLRPVEQPDDANFAGAAGLASPPSGGGFRSGFLVVMTVAILAAALYIVAPRLGSMVPAFAGPLDSYVALIDSMRQQLDGMMQSATVAINGS